jgi:hypothetical protein
VKSYAKIFWIRFAHLKQALKSESNRESPWTQIVEQALARYRHAAGRVESILSNSIVNSVPHKSCEPKRPCRPSLVLTRVLGAKRRWLEVSVSATGIAPADEGPFGSTQRVHPEAGEIISRK